MPTESQQNCYNLWPTTGGLAFNVMVATAGAKTINIEIKKEIFFWENNITRYVELAVNGLSRMTDLRAY